MKKLFLLTTIIIFIELVSRFAAQTFDPQTRTNLSLSAVNGNNTELRLYETARELNRPYYIVAYFVIAAVIFLPKTKQNKTQNAE